METGRNEDQFEAVAMRRPMWSASTFRSVTVQLRSSPVPEDHERRLSVVTFSSGETINAIIYTQRNTPEGAPEVTLSLLLAEFHL